MYIMAVTAPDVHYGSHSARCTLWQLERQMESETMNVCYTCMYQYASILLNTRKKMGFKIKEVTDFCQHHFSETIHYQIWNMIEQKLACLMSLLLN